MDRSVAQGRPADPASGRPVDPPSTPPRRGRASASCWPSSRRRDLPRHAHRSLLRPLRLAGGRPSSRARRRSATPSRPRRGDLGQHLLPGRPAGRHDRRRPARPAALPAAAGRPADAVRRALGPRDGRPAALHAPRRRRRGARAGGCSAGCRSGPSVRLATTVFFAFGTVFWYTAQIATTWYQAHIVAVGLTFLAIGARARRRTRRPRRDDADAPTAAADRRGRADRGGRALAPAPPRPRPPPVPRRPPVRAGLHGPPDGRLRRAVLPVRRRRRRWRRRGWSAALGAAHPDRAAARLQPRLERPRSSSPAYDYLYRLEAAATTALGYHPDWAIEDPRYLPQNAAIMFLTPPDLLPAAPARRARRPRDPGLHGRPARSAACSTRPARSPCRATSG